MSTGDSGTSITTKTQLAETKTCVFVLEPTSNGSQLAQHRHTNTENTADYT